MSPIRREQWPSILPSLGAIFERLADVLDLIGTALPQPIFDADPAIERWAFPEKSREVAVLCLAAKAVSSVHAAFAMWSVAHLHEMWAVLRFVGESNDDVMLLSLPLASDELTDMQRGKLAEFFHEGALSSDRSNRSKKPPMVRRDSIAAALGTAMHASTGLNPHDAISGYKLLHAIHSSYVHGNYWAVMSMVSGDPGAGYRFNVLGLHGNVKEAGELLRYLLTQVLLTARTLETAANRLRSVEGAAMCKEVVQLAATLIPPED